MIKQYLEPILNYYGIQASEKIVNILSENINERNCIKGELLEEPGPASEGRCLLLIQSIAHSYESLSLYDETFYAGTMIWPRKSLIFIPSALFDNLEITEYIQALEPGPYFSIRYPVLQHLLQKYSGLRHLFHILSRHQSIQRYKHNLLLHLPPKTRVNMFEEDYSRFCKVASISQRALHLALTRQTYSKILSSIV